MDTALKNVKINNNVYTVLANMKVRHGHSSKKCKNKQQCVYSAGEHESKTCQNKQQLTCCNCSASNNKYKLNRKINHCASDYKKCETYKSRLAFLRSKTDYSIST